MSNSKENASYETLPDYQPITPPPIVREPLSIEDLSAVLADDDLVDHVEYPPSKRWTEHQFARREIDAAFNSVRTGLVVPLIIDSPSSFLSSLLGSKADKITSLERWVVYSRYRSLQKDAVRDTKAYLGRSDLINHLLRARRIALTWCDFLYIHGIRSDTIDWQIFIAKWCVYDYFNDYITFMKFHTLWLSFHHRSRHGIKELMQEPQCSVPCPDLPGLIISVSIRSRMIQILSSDRSRSWLLSEDLLIGIKRGLPSMLEAEVQTKVMKYVREMATPMKVNPLLLKAIQRTCRELTGKKYLDVKHGAYQISDRAGCGAPVETLGIRGFVRRELKSFMGCLSPELVGFKNGLKPEARYEVVEDYWENYCDICEKWSGELLGPTLTRVEISPIYEPLKVRLITKGDPHLYSLLKPFQQAMWDCLRKNPMFSLIGEEVNDELLRKQLSKLCPTEGNLMLNELLFEADGDLNDYVKEMCLVSGDYSAATDNIPLEYTICALENLFPPYTMQVLRKAIGAQVYTVPRGSCGPMLDTREAIAALLGQSIDNSKDYFIQKRGQLMGSPLSFPILCIINAAVYRYSVEKHVERFYVDMEHGLSEPDGELSKHFVNLRNKILTHYYNTDHSTLEESLLKICEDYKRDLVGQAMERNVNMGPFQGIITPAYYTGLQGCMDRAPQQNFDRYWDMIEDVILEWFENSKNATDPGKVSDHNLVRLEELPCLINGDDILFKTTVSHYNSWEFYCNELGWKLSPGKSFVSREFVQINSQTRKVIWNVIRQEERHEEHRPQFYINATEIVPYNNYGFLSMMGKDVKVTSDSDIEKVVQNWADKAVEIQRISKGNFWNFKDDSADPAGRVMEVLKHNFSAYAEKVKEMGLMPFQPDLFNPFELGGLGLGHNPETGEISNFNLKAATEALNWHLVKKIPLFTDAWTEKCSCKTDDNCQAASCKKRKWVKVDNKDDYTKKFAHEDHKTYLLSNRIEEIDHVHFVRSKIGPSFTY